MAGAPLPVEATVRRSRLRAIPLRSMFPNLVTLLAIAMGLTSIRLAVEGRLELAVGAIVLAAFLDGIDGRIARLLKSTSRFGEQMDSLADFVNFGVAPALVLYFSMLRELRSLGWIVALLYAICGCLRLARFNAMLDAPELPKWHGSFFVGVPAPAGAGLVMAPLYLLLLGWQPEDGAVLLVALYVLLVGGLMVSTLPTFSGKAMGRRVPSDLVLPMLIGIVAYVALLLTWPWHTLIVCVLLYVLALPFGWMSFRRRLRLHRDDAGPLAPTGI